MTVSQKDYFSSEALVQLFASRIVKSRAVGLDGTRLEKFEETLLAECQLIEKKVLSSSFGFTNYREKLILKGAKSFPRQISIPTVRDRLALRAICNCLGTLAPDARTLPPHFHIKEISNLIRGSDKPLSFLRVDVKNFFPTLRHDLLIQALVQIGCHEFLISLIFKALTNGTGYSKSGKDNTIGVPQGLSISNLLSSIYMSDFDKEQMGFGGYRRYVDDILIIDESHKINQRYKTLYFALSKIGLESHPMNMSGKTEIKRIGEGIDYLGYHLSPRQISVRESSYKKMFENLSKVFTQFKYKKNYRQFIFKLNIRITGCIVDGKRKGWLMFFSQMDNIHQLKFLDEFVEKQFARLKIPYSKDETRRFVKAYHEIRYKGVASPYIPNFDSFGLSEQYNVISQLTGVPLEELNSRSRESTDSEFKALVAKEVSDLEQDVLNSIS